MTDLSAVYKSILSLKVRLHDKQMIFLTFLFNKKKREKWSFKRTLFIYRRGKLLDRVFS